MQDTILRDDEDCPCGSGKKYGDCCKVKTDVGPVVSKKPAHVLLNERMKRSMKQCCLHPDHLNCNGSIKEAHALQNHKIISLLAGNEHHVWMMDKKQQPTVVEGKAGEEPIVLMLFNKTSANKATTETCFCDRHDNIAFAAIEKGAPDFDKSNEEMKFVYAYKAFIFEYYKQWMGWEIFHDCFKERPAVFSTPDMVAMYQMLQLKKAEFEPIKNYYDNQIMAGTHNGVETCVIEIPEKIGFAAYSYVALNFDLNGNMIQNIDNGIMHRIAITIFPEESQSYILLSCLKTEEKYYKSFFDQLKSASLDRIKYYFNMMLPLYTENLVFSKELWESQGDMGQFGITHMANLHGPDAVKLEQCVGLAIKQATRKKKFDYTQRGKFDLFKIV